MKSSLFKNSIVHLLYPHNCIGCGSDVISDKNFLCLECIYDLPYTHFEMHAGNPVEKIFWGRIPIAAAMSEFYFSKASMVQNFIHELKYNGNKEAAHYFGNLMGKSLLNSNRFNIDVLVPLPLFEKKEKLRGYNQAEIICNGISEILEKPVIRKNVIRKVSTETQTKKHRTERWKNVENTFVVQNANQLEGKNILLVDDVITTGATLEACGAEILNVKNIKLHIASLAVATR
ncbi:MAG: phosphoribosyltransferase family protein [Ginsengibacter sp.]